MDLAQYMLTSIQRVLSRNREFFYKLSDQADRIIVWLVGFSIASIALTISNTQALKEIFINLPLLIITFSCVTIIFGILYRTFMFIAQTIENQMLVNFESYLEFYNNPPNFAMPRDLTNNESINDLVQFLMEDYKVELPKIDENYLPSEEYLKIQNDLSKLYKTLADPDNRHFESQKATIKNVLKSNFGYSDKKLDSIFNPVKSKTNLHKIYWFSFYTSIILFILTTLVFVSGFVIFLTKYLNNIICS